MGSMTEVNTSHYRLSLFRGDRCLIISHKSICSRSTNSGTNSIQLLLMTRAPISCHRHFPIDLYCSRNLDLIPKDSNIAVISNSNLVFVYVISD